MTAYLICVIGCAFLWARMEIAIEGKDGWASSLPTWRIEHHILLDLFWGGRVMTGYHLWAFTGVLALFHLPLAWTGTWSIREELRVLGGVAFFWIAEDALWFAMNPHYGIRALRPERAPWHPRWFLGLPADYWIFGALGVLALALS